MAAWLHNFTRRASWRLIILILFLGVAAPQVNAGLFDDLGKLMKDPARPDVVVTSVQLDRQQADIGQTVRATVNVSNTGRGRAKSVRLTLGAQSTSGTFPLVSAELGSMGGNTSTTYVGTFTVPNVNQGGTYRIVASLAASGESRRSNNSGQASLDVKVPARSTTVSAPSTSSAPSNPAPLAAVTAAITPSAASAAAPCDYYASPNGTGNGRSTSSPFRIGNFWPVALPGKTLCLMDGTYQGEANMISPGKVAPGLSGTSGSPITIRALNDGAVTLDGQFTWSAISLNNNQWFVLEGFNAKSGGPATLNQGPVWANTGNNSHLRARRLVLWDANMTTNISVISNDIGNGSFNPSTDVLLEDVAIFGSGRKQVVLGTRASTASDQVICRRCWFRWEGSIAGGVGPSLSSNYDNYGGTCENCIASFTAQSMPQTYRETGQGGEDIGGAWHTDGGLPFGSGGVFMNDSQRSAATKCANVKLLGSLFYLPADGNYVNGYAIVNRHFDSCVTMRHVYSYIAPTHPRFNELPGWILDSGRASDNTVPATPGTQFATNMTSVRASRPADSIDSSWNLGSGSTGWSVGTSAAAVANPWTNTGAGANLCKRWVNGVVTNEPLWPWPMNQRIYDATASAGSYSGPCPNCSGGRAMRVGTDVTADIEALLGSIPSSCKASP